VYFAVREICRFVLQLKFSIKIYILIGAIYSINVRYKLDLKSYLCRV